MIARLLGFVLAFGAIAATAHTQQQAPHAGRTCTSAATTAPDESGLS